MLKGHAPRRIVLPKIKHEQLHHALTKVFNDSVTPTDMSQMSTMRQAQLYFVPFYEVAGKRASMTRMDRDIRLLDGTLTAHQLSLGQVPDTVVSLRDFSFTTPACDIRGWGLEYVSISSMLGADSSAELAAFDSQSLQQIGSVIPPSMQPEEAEERMKKQILQTVHRIEDQILDKRISVIYYPVWRVSFKYRDRLFLATIDAVTGEVIYSLLPENDRFRIPYFLASVVLTSLFFSGVVRMALFMGKLFAGIPIPFIAFSHSLLFSSLFLFGSFIGLTFLLGASWDKLRYPGEVQFAGKEKFHVRIGRPAKTFFDKLMDRELEIIQSWVNNAVKQQERRMYGGD